MGQSNFLIRGTNWIGDSVMSLAALREIRRLFPDCRISLLVKGWVAGLFRAQGLVDEILEIETNRRSVHRVLTLPARLRGFERAILFQNAFEAALIAFLARIPERIGYRTQGRSWLLTRGALPRIKSLNRHQIYYYLDLLFQTGISPVDYLNDDSFRPDIHLTVPAKGMKDARGLLKESGIDGKRPVVGINPGAYYGPAKRWFTDRYARLADLLAEAGVHVVILGASSDLQTTDEILSYAKSTPHVLTGRMDLPCLLGVLGLCNLVITNDSGPMHLAAALGTPQIALFGSTDEVATGPFSDRARVLHKHVECSPCLLRECPLDLNCFDRIEVEEVLETALEALNCG